MSAPAAMVNSTLTLEGASVIHIKKMLLLLLCGGLVVSFAALAQQEPPPPSVVVTEVIGQDITPRFENVGRVEAVDTVDLRARVQGYLEQRSFQEGSVVKRGDLLFVIEKAPYQIIVDQRNADLAGAEASVKNARATLARNRDLQKKKLVSRADLDTAIANEATANASVLQAQAALKAAELDLSYTDIYSPIDGQISRARYSIGNLVDANSGPLATVTSLNPVYVTMAVSEKDLLDARRQGIDLDNPQVEPFLILSDDVQYDSVGRFDYLDTQVNQSTDTILARAVFANPDQLLLPGQFVSILVRQKQAISALVVPQQAVQADQSGYFVLVVDRANKVEVRRVDVGDQVASAWIISAGLAQGERVIVEGIQKVRPDMTVNPVTAGS